MLTLLVAAVFAALAGLIFWAQRDEPNRCTPDEPLTQVDIKLASGPFGRHNP